MNWEAVGAVADSIGAAGVIISLIYLAVQIRSQVQDNRITSQNDIAQQLNSTYGDIASDSELAAIFDRGIHNFESLEHVELIRFSMYMNRWFRIIEVLLTQYQRGRVEESFWSGIDVGMRELCKYPGVQTWWKNRQKIFSEAMRKYVESVTSSEDPPRFFEYKWSR